MTIFAMHLTAVWPSKPRLITIPHHPPRTCQACFKSNRYEPYMVLPMTPMTPMFEEAFHGYGKNKIQHVVHLRYIGFEFSVISHAFVIHFPHLKSASRLTWESKRHTDRQNR